MNKYKICVYAIAKNESKFVDRWIDSVSEADLIIVLDTGSTDDTIEKLKLRGAQVFSKKIEPWRFDVARNMAMSYIPKDYDICVSNDLDEVFEPGWREKIEKFWDSTTTRARYLFTCSFQEDGTLNKQFVMEKIHSRKNYRWIHPVHEILDYTGERKEEFVFVEDLVLNHYPDALKSRDQYLPLLELSALENPMDPQTIFWLGRENLYYQKYDECIKALEVYLKLPDATWNEERSAAMRFIGDCYYKKNDVKSAKKWYFNAIAENQNIREPYLAIALLGYHTFDWALTYLAVIKALNINEKSDSYLVEIKAWNETFYDLGAIACYWLEMYEKSLEYAKKALEMTPDNERLKNNLKLIKEKINKLKLGEEK